MKPIFDRDYPVTSILLILTNLFCLDVPALLRFPIQRFPKPYITLGRYVATYNQEDAYGDFWRVFAAIFVHIGLEHFVVNMLTLYFLGRQVRSYLRLLEILIYT